MHLADKRKLHRRSIEATSYRGWYNLAIWRGKGGLREQQLSQQPLCERCLTMEVIEPATVVHHRTKHEGNWDLFVDPNNHESLCKPHHDSDGQREDLGQTVLRFDASGWPVG